ncbi:agmatine/peptidylarginine deiminase [Citricoccus sp. GCM10030269]|uniref:agmatine deiminase family protein n=1 Tax=Citricoccus sp. GCM10030269 TaxID=3273388 RepID=UPI0036132E56
MRQEPQAASVGGGATGVSTAVWHLPADTEPQERLWMSFPRDYARMGTTTWELSGARRAWSRVAHAVMDYQPVTLLVDPADRQIVHTYVDPMIPVVPVAMDNPFLRLTGPTFTTGAVITEGRGRAQHRGVDRGDDPWADRGRGNGAGGAGGGGAGGGGAGAHGAGRRQLGMIDWVFNGFGRRPGLEYRLDDVTGGTIAELTGADRQLSLMVNEGGAFITDGEGTLIASESVLLDPSRNGGWTREHIEAEFTRYTDIRKIIWLPSGLTRDSGPFGVGAQIDQLVAFASPTVVLLHWQENPAHPDHEVSMRTLNVLQNETDARGRPLNVATVTAPLAGQDDRGPLSWSYVNVLPVNGAVVVPSFEDPHDDGAHQLLQAAYPGRKVVPIPAQRLYRRGVGIRQVALPQPSRQA